MQLGAFSISLAVGVWRLWCEHPDQHPDTAGPQIQDDVIPPYPDSNPNRTRPSGPGLGVS